MSSPHAKRKFVIKPAVPLNSDINVTPLVDVVLVMLIIFMVVTPLLEKDIGVGVPTTEQVENPEDLPDQFVVKVDAEGKLKFNGAEVEKDQLLDKLKARLERKRRDQDKVVFVVADDAANYGVVVSILDIAKQSGAAALGMMTEKPAEKE